MVRKIITCASFGGTGSSAITDLFKEFSNVVSLGDYEFAIAHETDGISDLEHYLLDDNHRLKADEAIYRFKRLVKRLRKEYSRYINDFQSISERYIDSLIEVKWQGYWHGQRYRYNVLNRFLIYSLPAKIQKKIYKYFLKKTGYEYVPYFRRTETTYSNPDNFYDATRIYFDSIISNLKDCPNDQIEYIALDQLVPPTNTERYVNYFADIKVICVDRDPRDLYTLNKMYWKEGWIPSIDPYTFSKWFRAVRKNINYNKSTPSVLRLKFEDLIYNYDNTIHKIYDFIGINEDEHIKKFVHFNPQRSIKNTQVWLKHESILEDIKIIERELEEFCYNFK